MIITEICGITTSNRSRHDIAFLTKDDGGHISFRAGFIADMMIAIIVRIIEVGRILCHIDTAQVITSSRSDLNIDTISPLPNMTEWILNTTIAGNGSRIFDGLAI